jgi:hypothetical protein
MSHLSRIVAVALVAMATVAYAGAEKPCYTKDGSAKQGALVAPSVRELKKARSIRASGDVAAWRQLLDRKQVAHIPAGTRVFVEEKSEGNYRIRLEGATESVWTSGYYLTCMK